MSRIFKSCGVRPNIRYFAEDSNIIASMIECGLGVGIMSELILNRMPYHIVHMPLDPPQYRDIALAVRSNGIPSPAVSPFSGACSELGCRTHIIPRVFVLK